MGKCVNRLLVGGVFILLSVFCLMFAVQPAHAATDEFVAMNVTFKNSVDEITVPVYGTSYKANSYWFTVKSDPLPEIRVASQNEYTNVSVSVLRPDLIDESTLTYHTSVKPSSLWQIIPIIKFNMTSVVADKKSRQVACTVSAWQCNMKVVKPSTTASSKGFHPSKNNYIMFFSGSEFECKNKPGATFYITTRVLNSKGAAVFSKKWKIDQGSSFCYRWDGKASKNNPAKAKAGSYVKDGKYKLQIELSCVQSGNVLGKVSKTAAFKVSRKAPAGEKGLAKAKRVPLLTGYANIDYMAEQMVKAAGVKSGMSDDQKVRRIYHYITTHFKHTHYGAGSKYTIHYNLKKLKGKVASYKKKNDAKYNKGKIAYTGKHPNIEWNMVRRAGVCDDHAEVFVVLCNHAGVEAATCGGAYINSDGSLAPHAWDYAVINGKRYYYDVDIELQNLGKGQGDYYWYKKTYAESKQTHKYDYQG